MTKITSECVTIGWQPHGTVDNLKRYTWIPPFGHQTIEKIDFKEILKITRNSILHKTKIRTTVRARGLASQGKTVLTICLSQIILYNFYSYFFLLLQLKHHGQGNL